MSFKKVIDLLDKIEAVTNYKQVTEQNWDLIEQCNAHERRIQDLENKVKRQKDIRIQYKESMYSLDGFQALVEFSVEEWKKNTLATLLEEKWEMERYYLVEDTIQRYLLDYPDNCPTNIKEHIERVTQSRLSELETKRWPEYILEEATPFFQQKLKDQFMALSRKIQIGCARCGRDSTLQLRPNDLRILINTGKILTECDNINCRNLVGDRSLIILTFDQVVTGHLLKEPPNKWVVVTPGDKSTEPDEEKNQEPPSRWVTFTPNNEPKKPEKGKDDE